jgi:uncharacterized RDD family membrane protein YckC
MSELTINTTQNVTINFTAASVGERMLATFLDLLVQIAYVIVVFYVFFEFFGISERLDEMNQWSAMAIFSLFGLPIFLYSLVLESFLEGQTLGKKIIKIKVVKIDGYQASFGDYLIRWLFKIIEGNSIFAIIGIIAMATSKKVQRLGDMAAGTAIITLKNNISINNTILENIGEAYIPTYSQVIKLSDNDMRIIKDTFLQAKSKEDRDTILKLSAKIEKVTGIKNQSGNESDFIKTVLKDYNFYTQNM